MGPRATLLTSLHVARFAPEEVQSRNAAAEVEPRTAGLTPAAVDAIWQAAVDLYRTGLHPALSLCVRRRGHVVLDRALGHLRGNAPGDLAGTPKVLARHDALFNLYSASKAVTAMLVHLMDERGLVHLDDPVAETIPEFGRHGMEWITLRHVLTHRAGITNVPGQRVDLSLLSDRKRILEQICEARPLSVPGRRLSYHAVTGGYVLGEIIARVTGRDLRAVLQSEVLEPLGLSALNYGVPPARLGDVAENAFTGMPALPPTSWLVERSLGVGVHDAVRLSNTAEFLTSIIPSGNVIGSANDACRFFELLLRSGELDGARIFGRRTVRRAVAETSFLEVDSFLGLPVRYSMGFMLGGAWFSPYGADTADAFGHVGFTTVVAWADPARDLSVCLMTSGKPFITPGQLKWLAVPRTIARVCPPI